MVVAVVTSTDNSHLLLFCQGFKEHIFLMIVYFNVILRLLFHLFFVGVGKSSLLLRFADNTFSGA